MFINMLWVGLGGFFGASCRYGLYEACRYWLPASFFPLGTFLANMTGCFLIGLSAGLIQLKTGAVAPNIKLFVITGFLGGFTTYSAFAYESYFLIKNGQHVTALMNIALHIILGMILVGGGYMLAKFL